MNLIFDLFIAICLIAVSVRIILVREHFQTIVLFITFGLFLALAWTRLQSPDIAIAEAAVGAGLTGVLLMDSLGAIKTSRKPARNRIPLKLVFLTIALIIALSYSAVHIPYDFSGLSQAAHDAMPASGLEYPVTAVLLDFRGYDTWLELGVLLAAVTGVLALRRRTNLTGSLLPAPAEPVGRWIIKILLPFMVLIGGYLLWLGAYAPGGAFQAGVVLAGAGVMLWQAGHPSIAVLPGIWWRILLCSGFSAFLILAVLSLFYADQMLTHPQSKAWILGIEYAATISIAICLVSLIQASPGSKPDSTIPN
ncbi:hydrogenase subunit MbhD domain-containing protein [Desulfonatronovibrio magnus]|uniref:hydrogenase subunit MbhD domain-containing protein n=1 Tax=Desulfonatronovibrio magnus TaxID=698827 RepID=UPI0005EADB58|nr:hydrogenase subunit MbhD domain-containing protein [Desulfonatronovibrio magnus]